jgi:isopentenyl phosphate kinase
MKIIKLGGSIVTYKGADSGPPYRWKESTLHYRVKDNDIRTISRILRKHSEEKFILVHGGGTHGHRTVKRWNTGAAKGKECLKIWEVKWRMLQLTERIIHIMGEEKVPVVSVSPSDIMELDGRSIVSMNLEVIQNLVKDGCIPILKGDLAVDINGGWSIVSGDEIMVELVRKGSRGDLEQIDTAVMCMDINGFYDELGGSGENLLKDIGPKEYHENIAKWRSMISSSSKNKDASGGVLRKVESCHRIASMGCEAWMIGGLLENSLSNVLDGKHSGTRFKAFQGSDECQRGECGQIGE